MAMYTMPMKFMERANLRKAKRAASATWQKNLTFSRNWKTKPTRTIGISTMTHVTAGLTLKLT